MDIRHTDFKLALINPFGIARNTRTHNDVVITNIDGGWGEASPIKLYGEDVESVKSTLAKIAAMDLPDADYVEDIADFLENEIPMNFAAKAAVDIALHDRLGKKLGVPLYKLFGKNPNKTMISSFTIGIDTIEEMLRKVDEAKSYKILKIKLGKDLKHDIEVMKLIRKAVGDKILRVDANGGWTLDEAKQALPVMADLGVEYVEQPLYKGSLDELRELKKNAPVALFVDEDSMINADLPKLIGAVDGINIKLMKTGGIVEARRMIGTARALGFRIMIGCMIETGIAISAAAHLAPFCDNIDLDGNILIGNDPVNGVTCEADGTFTLSDKPGLGVEVKPGVAELEAIAG